jgi:hypothetical protein
MFKYAKKLVAHDQRVKESVAMVKQVGINDARAVIQGEVHFLERKKLVLERPYYKLFTTLKGSNTVQRLIEEAHDKMNAFQKELDRDTGIALLQRADEVLWDLQDEIDQVRGVTGEERKRRKGGAIVPSCAMTLLPTPMPFLTP